MTPSDLLYEMIDVYCGTVALNTSDTKKMLHIKNMVVNDSIEVDQFFFGQDTKEVGGKSKDALVAAVEKFIIDSDLQDNTPALKHIYISKKNYRAMKAALKTQT